MKRSMMMGIFGFGLLPFLAMGCSHGNRCCKMRYMVPCSGGQTVVQAAPVKTDAEIKSVAHKEEDNNDTVLLNAVAPSMNPYGGDVCGIVSFSGSDAKRLGIRPGYTPTALAVGSRKDSDLQRCGATEKQPVSYLPDTRGTGE